MCVVCSSVEPLEPDDQTQTNSQTRKEVPHGGQVLVLVLCLEPSRTKVGPGSVYFQSVCGAGTLTGPCVCVCVHSYTDPQVSMDLLRAVLQPSFNDDIMAVFQKYHQVSEGPPSLFTHRLSQSEPPSVDPALQHTWLQMG